MRPFFWCGVAMALACFRAGAQSPPDDELYNETYRPQFHFTARQNWLNDPNGLVFYKGEYHLFFQHNPKGREWGNMTWGHAVSPDLVHWEQLPNAIEPDALGTIFSGSAVVDWDNTAGFARGDEKTLVAIYTAAGKPFTQCLAYSTDRGRTWTKYDKNPVLPHIIGENRDPKVIWHAPSKRWIMTLYKDKNDYAFFASPDLKTWTHLHDITIPGCAECPDFFPLAVDGDRSKTKWVWTAANGRYLVGTFDGSRCTPEAGPLQVDYGKNYYAVQTYSDIPDSDGRRIQVAWMSGGKYPSMPFNQQMSFPCELRLRSSPDGPRLCRTPVKEIETLHGDAKEWSDLAVKPGDNPLAGLTGDLFDIRAEIEPGDAQSFGFKCRGEPVTVSLKDRKLTCLGAAADLELVKGRVELQILVDRTSLEVFGNGGRVSLTSCFLPKPEERGLELFAVGGTAKVVSLRVVSLRSAWPFTASPLTDEKAFTAGIEGPGCDARGNVYAVNFARQQTIGRVTPDGKGEVWVELPGKSTGNGIVFDHKGLMYVADYVGHNILRIDPETRKVAVFAHDDKMHQPNDLAIAPDDTLYASDPDWGAGTGQVWRIDRDGTTTLAAGKMGTANGIEVSPDGKKLYVNESVQRNVWAFDIAADGSLAGKRLLKKFDDFGMDGMRCDVDGNLYVSRYGKGTVAVLSPEGKVLREIDVLGEAPSNLCFGGPDGRTVYVTEVKKQRLVQFRVARPGLAWQRWQKK